MLGLDSASQAHSRVSNVNFDIWDGFYYYLLENSQRQSSCLLGVCVKGIVRPFNSLKCLFRIMHLKSPSKCQLSATTWGSINMSFNITNGNKCSYPLEVSIKGIAPAFNSLNCLCGILHPKLTAVCQISARYFMHNSQRQSSCHLRFK